MKLPKEVLAELGLKNGDFVELTLKDVHIGTRDRHEGVGWFSASDAS